MALKCVVRQKGEVAILDLSGVMSLPDPGASDAEGSITLGEKVRELMDSGQRKILLNFAAVSYMDSAGIGQLIGSFTSARNRGAALKLMKPTRDVRKLLEMTKLAGVMDVRDDEESALAAFAGSASP
jgi:anti-sigma B factor antagonist